MPILSIRLRGLKQRQANDLEKLKLRCFHEQDGSLTLTVDGDSLEAVPNEQRLRAILGIKRQPGASRNYVDERNSAKPRRRHRVAPVAAAPVAAAPRERAPRETLTIGWPSGCNWHGDTTDIKELSGLGLPSQRCFVQWDLVEHSFGNDRNAFERFKAIFNDATLVRRQGSQGFVRWQETRSRLISGEVKSYTCTMKLKALGVQGNARCYCWHETSVCGRTLYHVFDYEPYTH